MSGSDGLDVGNEGEGRVKGERLSTNTESEKVVLSRKTRLVLTRLKATISLDGGDGPPKEK